MRLSPGETREDDAGIVHRAYEAEEVAPQGFQYTMVYIWCGNTRATKRVYKTVTCLWCQTVEPNWGHP